ncbi:hypothetical protein QO010_000552 [Caulobacter ginsengisoli]|uniref:Uncharacterized protein n=1 Tax=Caulobacter ginsengisoli TaxID=400775 RepID=A0ABU0ILB2_9CAUL|nr:hypothetical protein [Caulobacter ginsengisoli]MDQ0462804.1 hypothetical protein [Caulobacter ginsengisoli]
MDKKRYQRRVATCGALGLAVLAAIVWVNWMRFNPSGPEIAWAWIKTVGLVMLFMALASIAIRGRPAGLFIDSRNRVSLSRFQAAGWTVIVISALVTLVAALIRLGVKDPLNIDLPAELLAAMGISAGTLVASPALLTLKSPSDAPSGDAAGQAAADDVAAATGRSDGQAVVSGSIVGWSSASDAQWMDMFRGEQVGDAATADLSKIQQFLITLLLLGVYAAALWSFFYAGHLGPLHAPAAGEPTFTATLPPLSERFIWLMGISHVGYLAAKALPSPAATPAAPTDGAG